MAQAAIVGFLAPLGGVKRELDGLPVGLERPTDLKLIGREQIREMNLEDAHRALGLIG